MDQLRIAKFTSNDLPFGKMMTDLEGWHRTVTDWNRLLRIEPLGMIKAQLDGRDVGIAGFLSYKDVSWIHSVIVLPEFRGKGIGRAMVEKCIANARENGCPCIKLDSVRGFEGFYRSLGFAEEFESHRYLADGAPFPKVAEEVRPSDMGSIMAFDRAAVGVDRGRVLRAIFEDKTDLAFCTREAAVITGYILGREGEERVQIGPCVAKGGDYSIGHQLITTLIGSVGPERRFRMCVPGANRTAVRLVRDLGFASGIASTRMYLGERFQESAAVLSMISPEKG
ncbi:MAG: GNAT family N-acetyltransferase [Thermoplasmata archaeon]|nr:GNAT family N-acetyltransferase [Thermoplasmata archaeon]